MATEISVANLISSLNFSIDWTGDTVRHLFTMLFLCWAAIPSQVFSQSSDETECRELAKKIVFGWSKFIEENDVDVAVSLRGEALNTGSGRRSKIELLQDGEASSTKDSLFLKYNEIAFGFNNYYYFKVNKAAAASIWNIEILEPLNSIETIIQSGIATYANDLEPSIGILSIRWVESIRVLDFERKVNESGTPIIELNFAIDSFRNPNPFLIDAPSEKGRCVLLDNQFYLPLNVEVEFQTRKWESFPQGKIGKIKSEMRYHESGDSNYQLTELICNYWCKDNASDAEATFLKTWRFLPLESKIPKDQRFSLTRLGLPEPSHLIPKKSPIKYWVIGFGILSAVAWIVAKKTKQ